MKKHGSHNSLERRVYLSFLESLIEHDYNDLWSSNSNRERDLLEIRERVHLEGLPFLTKGLPSLGKALDKSLATGQPFTPPSGFKLDRGDRFPLLFGDLFRSVFDDSGELLSSASHKSVTGIRQLTLMFYKLELPYDHEDTQRVLDGFVGTDESLPQVGDRDFSSNPLYRRARGLIAHVCGGLDPANIIPRHGTGAVATRECVRRKSKFSRLYSSTEKIFPFTEYFRYSLAHVSDTVDEIQKLEVLPEPCARVALVPKDSRGPRIISMEPLEIQWLQQGLMLPLVRQIERHPLTRGHVNFRDQTCNRNLALSSSIADDWVTLDMKDASDRVSLALVKYLFEGTRLWAALEATRSTETVLPDGRVVRMRKFAPMGSALCFPIESLVFWALSVSYLWTGLGYSRSFACSSVYVYGDDLIVPKAHWESLVKVLQDADLMINQDKCCVATGFRESCGMDAFRGVDVTPLRIRRRLTNSQHQWVPSYVEYSNLAYRKGLVSLAETIEYAITQPERAIGNSAEGLFANGNNTLGSLIPYTDKPIGILSFVRDYSTLKTNRIRRVKYRWSKRYQRYEVRGLEVQVKKLAPLYSGWDELLRAWHLYNDASEIESEVNAQALRDNVAHVFPNGDMLWRSEDPDMNLAYEKAGKTCFYMPCQDEPFVNSAAIFARVSLFGIQDWITRARFERRSNTYSDRRSLKLRIAWSPAD